MQMGVSVWIALALLAVVVVVVAAAAVVVVQCRLPVVSWIGRWCNVAKRPGTALPSCLLA